MTKKLMKSLAIAAVGSLLAVGSASALPINTGGPVGTATTLSDLNALIAGAMTSGSIDVVADQTGQALWTEAEGDVDAYVVNMVSGSSVFGLYSAKTGVSRELIASVGSSAGFQFADYNSDGTIDLHVGSDMSDLSSFVLGFGSTFGFYYGNSFTEDSANGGDALALAYSLGDGDTFEYSVTSIFGLAPDSFTSDGNNDWLLAFETTTPSDRSYTEGVFLIEDAAPVPEPATMLLLGTGLVSLAGVRRRKKTQK